MDTAKCFWIPGVAIARPRELDASFVLESTAQLIDPLATHFQEIMTSFISTFGSGVVKKGSGVLAELSPRGNLMARNSVRDRIMDRRLIIFEMFQLCKDFMQSCQEVFV